MKLALISLYQVVKHNTNGITSVHSQQVAWLHKCSWLEDPKTAMLRDLKETLQTLQQDNVMIIIGGNFNESNKNLGLHYMLATELGLQDIWDQQESPESHRRGSQCIDHIYMSQEMMECVNTMEYLDYPKEYYTDHRPMKVSLDLNSLGKVTIDVPRKQMKKIISSDIINVKTYILQQHQLYCHYKMQKKIEALMQESELCVTVNHLLSDKIMQQANLLDKQLTQISLQTERSIKSRPKYFITKKVTSLKNQLIETRYEMSKTKEDPEKMSNLEKKRKKILEELRHAIRHQSKIKNQEMMEKINTMIKNGNSTAKRWAQQRRSQLTVDKLRRVYYKLIYITGKRSDETQMVV
jgi:hypothetical protein